MSAEFLLKQHLKLSPNAQVKNLVPESLPDVPPENEWKLGRIWFNTTIGKFQAVIKKMDPSTGLPYEPTILEVALLGSDELGFARDGEYYPDGLFNFDTTTKVSNAVDEINEALKDLAPAEATTLRGDLDITINGGFKSGRISELDGTEQDVLRINKATYGDFIDYIVTSDTLSGKLPTQGFIVKDKQQLQFGKADQGIITAYFDSQATDSGVDLFANFEESSRDYYGVIQGYDAPEDQDTTDVQGTVTTRTVNPNKLNFKSSSGSLTINTIERYNDFKKWQRGTGTINFSNITPGEHSIYVMHSDVLGGPYKTNETDLFLDPNTTAPSTEIADFSISSGDTKFVSGIEFYNSNIFFNVDLKVTNAFNYTYWDKPIQLDMSYTDAGLLNWNESTSNLSAAVTPKWNDEIIITGHKIKFLFQNQIDTNVVLGAKSGKVATSWGSRVTKNIDILIDTNPINSNSTFLKETFKDEDYRLVDSTNFDDFASINTNKGAWDSSLELTSGNAQQFQGSLIKAKDNYSIYGLTADYTSFTNDDQYYYRQIKAPNKANSNGTLKITTTNSLGTDFEMYIKFPTLTGWLDVSKLYDAQDFANNYQNDGTACATNINQSYNTIEIDWTIGTNSTVDSDYSYIIKIVAKSTNVKIIEIEEISDNWK